MILTLYSGCREVTEDEGQLEAEYKNTYSYDIHCKLLDACGCLIAHRRRLYSAYVICKQHLKVMIVSNRPSRGSPLTFIS